LGGFDNRVEQSKTGTPLRLPLTSEVGEALDRTILKSGRPNRAHREVFLKVKPLLILLRETTCITSSRILEAAGRKFGFGLPKAGVHSLRHTLATRLLQKGNAVDNHCGDLGAYQFGVDTDLRKADVETLRSVALDPEEVNHADDASNTGFQSVLAPFIDRFLQDKHTCGYAYHEPIRILHRFDEFLCGKDGDTGVLDPSSELVGKETTRKCGNAQQRITIVVSSRSSCANWLSRVCARLDIECSEIDVCAKMLLTKSFESSFMPSIVGAYCAFTVATPRYAGSFSGSCTDAGFASEKC